MNICNTVRFVHNGSQNISLRTRSVCEWVFASSIYCVTAQRETTFCPKLWLATKPGAIPSIQQRNKRVWNGGILALLARKKTRSSIRSGKVMLTCFFDEKGPLMLERFETGGTVNANRFCDTLRKLKTAIKNRRRGRTSKGVSLLHDNARPHVAKVCKVLLHHFRWEVLHHPPYGPYLSPCDFHVFGPLKKSTEGTPVHRQ